MTDIKQLFNDKYMVFDGAFGTYYTQLTGNTGIPEPANENDPDTVIRIHMDYIEAGADVIRTNTFASNADTLCNGTAYEKVKKNIAAGVKCAKEAVKRSGRDVLIAGDIGPLRTVGTYDEYKIIAEELLDNGVDMIVFETFPDIDDIIPAIHYIKSRNKDIFVVVQFCVNQFGYTNTGLSGENLIRRACEDEDIDATGFNCGVGPSHLSTLMGKMNFDEETFITALPNASYPKIIRDRMIFMNNEKYFADKMEEIAGLGVDILGGCCGTSPEYIRKVATMAHSKEKVSRPPVAPISEISACEVTDTAFYSSARKNTSDSAGGDDAGDNNRIFAENDTADNDAVSDKKLIAVELAPPLNKNYKQLMDGANFLKSLGVDVVTFPDSPSGRTRADSVLMAAKVASQTGMCVMPHICCRDKNAIAIRSQLLGAQINDITNFLVITGDPVSTQMRQDVKSVFNFDSCGLMRVMRDMNEEEFKERPLVYGGCINYARLNLDVEIKRVRKKMDMGASFFFTQPVFCVEDVEKIKRIKEETGARILCGIMPLVSYRNAMFIKNEMAGINVPDEVAAMYEKLADKMPDGLSKDSPEYKQALKAAGEEVGVGIAVNMMRAANDFSDGFYYSIPFNRVYLIKRIMDKYNDQEGGALNEPD